MEYSTVVEHNEQGLLQIIAAAEQFEEFRFLEGVRLGRYNAQEIQDMTSQVRIFRERLEVESRRLAKFSEHFLNEYATDNNKQGLLFIPNGPHLVILIKMYRLLILHNNNPLTVY